MALKKFSDIPYYLIKDYFDLINEISVETPDSDEILLHQDVQFKNSTNTNVHWDTEHNGFLNFNASYDRVESKQTNKTRLIGPKTSIITKGGEWTTFYAKINDFGYKKIKMKPVQDQTWTEDSEDTQWLKFDKAEFNEYLPGVFRYDDKSKTPEDHLKENPEAFIEKLNDEEYTVVTKVELGPTQLPPSTVESMPISASGKHFGFKTYKPNHLNEDTEVTPEDEIFLRNDSYFHEWFRNELKYLGSEINNPNHARTSASDARFNEWDHQKFFNDKGMYSFIGPAWNFDLSETKWRIMHRGMKDFMYEALPENVRTGNDKLKTMTYELFDRSYQEAYNSQKNISTMIDPEEIQTEFLGYLAKYYDNDLDKYLLNEETQREYVKQLPYFLKKKGTYNSLFVMWKTLIRNNKNKITIFERWHDKYKRDNLMELDIFDIEEV